MPSGKRERKISYQKTGKKEKFEDWQGSCLGAV
jgi:hypothetical protein